MRKIQTVLRNQSFSQIYLSPFLLTIVYCLISFIFAPSKKKSMATTAEIRNGLCIEFNNDIYQFVEFQHVKPGKGNAFVRCRMKGLRSGRTLEHTFPAGHEIITARVMRKPHQFLYADAMGYNFMDQETFDQITIDGKVIENNDFLKEGDVCEVIIHEETNQILGCELPQHVVLEITYSEDAVAGNTATNAQKPATVETGATVMVPLFVNQGEKIKIDTRTRQYVERVKNK
jgi:elongation factor P